MPLYYIDTDDGLFRHEDAEGLALPDAETARHAAIRVLPELAADRQPDDDRREWQARVRDHAGTTLYVATLTLHGEWFVGPPARQAAD